MMRTTRRLFLAGLPVALSGCAPTLMARRGMPSSNSSSSGWRSIICGGGVQLGHSDLRLIAATPLQPKPWRPTPTP